MGSSTAGGMSASSTSWSAFFPARFIARISFTRPTGSVVTLTIASFDEEKVIVPDRMSFLTRNHSPSMV